METTLLLVALIVFAFAVSRVLARYASKYFVVSGVEYIVLGLFVGPVAGIIDAQTFSKLRILMALLLGLIGMLLGLSARGVRRSWGAAFVGLVTSLLVLVGVGAAALAIIEFVAEPVEPSFELARFGWDPYVLVFEAQVHNIRLAATIGCCAAVSSGAMLTEAARVLRARGPVLDFLELQALVSQLVALGVFGIVLASARATETADELNLPIWLWGVGIAAVGGVSGWLFSRFLGAERNETRVLVSAVGVVTFSAGIGVALGVSPLVVNLIAGMVVSFTSPDAPVVERAVVRLRHPILVLIRVFAAAAWAPVAGLIWLMPPLYTAARFVARRVTTHPMARVFRRDLPRVPRLGIGLLGQGGVAVAIALSFALRFPSDAGVVLTTVLGGLVLSDLFSFRAVRRVLADAGELDVIAEAELRAEIEAEMEEPSLGQSHVSHPIADVEEKAPAGRDPVGASHSHVAAADGERDEPITALTSVHASDEDEDTEVDESGASTARGHLEMDEDDEPEERR